MNEYENYYEWLDAVDSILLDRTMADTSVYEGEYAFPKAFKDGRSPTYAAIEALFDLNLEDVK